jgi:hypothetical protein
MPMLAIEEEYGYRYWVAELTDDEYSQLLQRWRTLRNLSCCVPVKFIIPQARAVEIEDCPYGEGVLRCHIHESDDSYLEGSDYKIPDDPDHLFWMDGLPYTREEVHALMDDPRYNP